MKLTKRRLGVLAVLTTAMVMAFASPALGQTDPSTSLSGDLGIKADALGLSVNLLWVVLGAVLVIFMQAGFALVETGFCRAKHAAHVMSTNFAIFGLGFVGFFLVGYPLMFGGFGAPAFGLEPLGDGLIGSGEWVFLWGKDGFALTGAGYGAAQMGFFLYMVAFMDTVATIPTGAMAERWKWKSFVGWGLFCGAIYYPLFGAWTWGGGWLAQLGNSSDLGFGYVDFAGSGVVHAVGGAAAFAGAIVLGPRLGKFVNGKAQSLAAHNIPMAQLGTFILLFGWFGFNAASTFAATDVRFAVVAANTAIAGAFGATVAMFYVMKRKGFKKPDPGMMVNGMLAGLVAITAPCAFVQPWAAAVIGSIAAVIIVEACLFFERKGIDDPVGAISVHGVGGLFGVLCVGLFADGRYGAGWNGTDHGDTGIVGLFYDTDLGLKQLGSQVIGVLVILGVILPIAFAFFKIQNALTKGGIRPTAEDEIAGLDLAEMGVLAYDNLVLNELDITGAEGREVVAAAPGGSVDPSIGR